MAGIFPQKVKHRFAVYPINSTSMYITKRNGNICLYKNLYSNAHSSIIHNAPRVRNNRNVCQLENEYI